MRSLSIEKRILLTVMLGMLGATAALVALTGQVLWSSTRDVLLQEQTVSVRGVARRVHNELSLRRSALESLAPQMERDGQLAAPDVLEESLRRGGTLNQLFKGGVIVLDAQANTLAESMTVPGRRGSNYMGTPFIAKALKDGQAALGPPTMGKALQIPLVGMLQPLFGADRQIIGLLVGVMDLAQGSVFERIDNEMVAGGGGTMFIIDPASRKFVTASDGRAALSPLPAAGTSALIDQVLAGRENGLALNGRGQSTLYAASVLQDNGWLVVQTQGLEDAFTTTMAQLVKVTALIVLLMVVIGAIVWWTLRWTLAPLGVAAAGIDDMAEGRAASQPLPVRREDEVGKLSAAFNRLLALRNEQDRKLQRERDFLQRQFQQSSDGIVLVEPGSWTIIDVNRRVSAITGHPVADAVGQALPALLGVEGDALPGLLEAATGDTAHSATEFLARRRDGQVLELEITATRVTVDEHQQVMVNLRDITERKKSERMKSEFVSTVSHELRTPLTSIAGSLGLINGGALGEVPMMMRQMLSIAHQNSNRLSMLINDLLDMDKLVAGKMTLDMREQPLRPLLEESIASNQSYAQQHGVSYALSDAVSPQVRVDGMRLQQVLANFLSNAAKFSPQGSTVEVGTELRGAAVRVSVRDHGSGIPAEFRGRIFQKFAQADASDTRQKGGTGLGLAITKELVERMGGQVGFDSVEGQGSTFWFELPVVAERRVVLEPGSARSNGMKLLVVEDEPDIALLLEAMLGRAGYVVETASSVAQARAKITSGGFDAVTLDMRLPDGNGADLVRELRADPVTSELPIVVISAATHAGRLALSGGFAAMDWLDKPIDERRLLSALRHVIRTRGEVSLGAKPRVLHVEDDADLHQVVAGQAAALADFDSAATLAEARRRLAGGTLYDLVLLDLGLPDGNGWDLLDELQSQHPGLPVVVMSANELTSEQMQQVEAALAKSRTSEERFLSVLQKLLPAPAGPTGDNKA